MSAVFSPCGTYRYALWRPLQRRLQPWVNETGGTLLFVMLNPSTADDIEDDPTIRRCLGYARREGFAKLAVANLYALRATDPRQLDQHEDPVGPLNDFWVSELASTADLIVAAWGARRSARPNRVLLVGRLLAESGKPVRCLGLTAEGCPRHPLYIPADRSLMPFELEIAA